MLLSYDVQHTLCTSISIIRFIILYHNVMGLPLVIGLLSDQSSQ